MIQNCIDQGYPVLKITQFEFTFFNVQIPKPLLLNIHGDPYTFQHFEDTFL